LRNADREKWPVGGREFVVAQVKLYAHKGPDYARDGKGFDEIVSLRLLSFTIKLYFF
jgi:hypothetical protein